MLDPASFITRNALESFSIRYANDQKDYVADALFAPVPTTKDLVKVWQYDTSALRLRNGKKNSKSPADIVDYGGFYTSRTLQLHKFGGFVDPKDERNFDSIVNDVSEETQSIILDSLLIEKEYDAMVLATTAANYPAALTTTLGAGATWAVGGDPATDVAVARLAVKAQCTKLPNAMVLSYVTLEYLKENPSLKDRLKYTTGQRITEEALRNLFGLDYLFVARGQMNTNVEGNATQTLSDIWADDAIVFVYDPTPRRKTVRYGVQPIHNQLYVRQWVDNELGSEDGPVKRLESGWNYTLAAGAVQSSSDGDFAGGYLIKNTY